MRNIDDFAFAGCTSLTEVALDKRIKSVGAGCFFGCESLRSVTLGEEIKRIEDGTFTDTALEEIYAPSLEMWLSLTFDRNFVNPLYFADKLYINGELLTDLVVPDGIEEINAFAFEGYRRLQSVTFPAGLKTIGEYAFSECDKITTVVLPDSLTEIADGAFSDCTALETLRLNERLVTLGKGAFSRTALKVLHLPDTLTAIGEWCFSGCAELVELTLGEGISSIGQYAFEDCEGLVSLFIDRTLTDVGDNAFVGCTGLTLYGYTDSYIEDYAYKFEVPFVAIDKHIHQWGEWQVQTPATCTEPGTLIRYCKYCAETETRPEYPVGHIFEDGVVEPTCTEPGYTIHVCTKCGYAYKTNYVNSLGHKFANETVMPTCTESGYVIHTCTVCGYSYTDSYTGSLGHRYDELVLLPSCTDDGNTTYVCIVCGYSFVGDIVPATGHKFTAEVTAPTCDTKGYTIYTCEYCGYGYVDDLVDAAGHAFVDVVTKPTCTEQGFTTHTCAVCGLVYTDKATKPTGHVWGEWYNTKPATETSKGEDTRECSICGEKQTRDITMMDACDDLPEGAWFTDACYWCIYMGYMSGTAKYTFSPNMALSRAQFVQILAKVEGVDLSKVVYQAKFTDVPDGQWYSKAVTWAVAFGVTGGMGNGIFSPNTQVTRAQLAVFLRTYSEKKEISTDSGAALEGYADYPSVPGWAKDALSWAVGLKLISGTDATHLSPSVSATRAQTALIIRNFRNNVLVANGIG